MTARPRKPARTRTSVEPGLEHLIPSTKESWKASSQAAKRVQPDELSLAQLAALSEEARIAYDRLRRIWHANLGPFETPQLVKLRNELSLIVDSNEDDFDKPKGMIAVDAHPGLGKTTAAKAFAHRFYRREIAEFGEFTDIGHERHPVCWIGMSGNTGLLDLNRAMLRFFAHQGSERGTAADFARRALDSMVRCECRLLVIDELHFLRGTGTNRTVIEVSNQFKYIANDFPVTVMFIGIGLQARGLLSDGETPMAGESGEYAEAVLAQLEWRTTRLTMRPFTVESDAHRREWRSLLLKLELCLALADKHEGFLADELSDYLYARTSGHIGSLITLVKRGCLAAIQSGDELLTRKILDEVPLEIGPERNRPHHQADIDARRITTRVAQSSKPPRASSKTTSSSGRAGA
jgi:hypothetical protein